MPLEHEVHSPVIEFLPHVVPAQVGVGKVAFVVAVNARWRDDRAMPVRQRNTFVFAARSFVNQLSWAVWLQKSYNVPLHSLFNAMKCQSPTSYEYQPSPRLPARQV